MGIRSLPDVIYLRECFDCDFTAGTLTWRHRPFHHFPDEACYRRWNTTWEGHPAGYQKKDTGRFWIRLEPYNFPRARIIWKMAYGDEPSRTIDHRDRNRANDAVGNLREATHAEQNRNRSTQAGIIHGFKGVFKNPRDRRVGARIHVDGKVIYLGRFDTAEEAGAAYLRAAEFYYGEFAAGGSSPKS